MNGGSVVGNVRTIGSIISRFVLAGGAPRDVQEAFIRATAVRTIKTLPIALIAAILLAPPFIAIDHILLPDRASILLAARLITIVIFGVAYAAIFMLRKTGQAERYSRSIFVAFLTPALAGTDAIIAFSGGAGTPFYTALGLVLLGVAVILPFGAVETALYALFIWGQYLAFETIVPLSHSAHHTGRMTNEINNYMSYFVISSIAVFCAQVRTREFVAQIRLKTQEQKNEKLILNILPKDVAEELKERGRAQARSYDSCTILFTDFVGFTKIADRLSPEVLVQALDEIFAEFDEIILRHKLEKLKTIGDAYMCAGGIPTARKGHLVDAALAALEMVEFIDSYNVGKHDNEWSIRIGIHSGPVTAGVIGRTKFAYDVWGDTVNVAARLESSSEAGKINLTEDTIRRISHIFTAENRGPIEVKGKGSLSMSFLTGIRPEFSKDDLAGC